MKEIYYGKEFKGYYAAEKRAKELGLSIGSMEGDRPIALFKLYPDLYFPGKWRHLDMEDRKALAGVMTGDKRGGPVELTIFDDVDKNPYV